MQCCVRATSWGRLPTNLRHANRRNACSVFTGPRPLIIHSYGGVRCYASMGEGWGFKKVQYTKYRITKPWTTDTEFDDLLLKEPSREDFAKFTKEAPVFLRFLKLVTDVENRPKAFIEFAKRCENGLVVEKDVFITKEELLKCIWENGFSQNEINAFEVAFPSDYQFHYPELAVLFDIPEEDCYKYCLRQRAKTPEDLVEVNRNIREYLWKEEKSLIDSAKSQKELGEEMILQQMKKYATDARCLEHLSHFKTEVQEQLSMYHRALQEQLKQQLVARMNAKLAAIQQAESSIQESLQEVIVQEIVDSFKRKYVADPTIQDAAFKAAVQELSGAKNVVDPVKAHFMASLRDLGAADLSSTIPKADGTVVERVAGVFQKRDQEFLDTFTVSPEEAKEVRKITQKCRSDKGYDFTKLSPAEFERLEELHDILTERVGFATVSEKSIEFLEAESESGKPLIEHVNKQIALAKARIQAARLTSFAKAFA